MTDLPDQIGPYRVEREIGRGGMGVVFLGWDDRLHRHVAIKSLPIELATDPDRLARFEREAKTLASLNHPGIAGIHGIEQQEGRKYLILEYVEGETLGDRLDRGPIPLDEALEIAVGIASGMEAAHDAGVIHRDLKPDNVKVTADGKVKVLDFGLARTEEASSASSQSGLSDALTRSRSPTVPGQIMGTAAYMSPEQARGRAVDRRSDIWSFGVILYEMLTGVGPFAGETLGDSIGAVLHRDVDLDRLPPGTPATIRNVLRRSLRRDRNERCRDIGDARLELQDRSLDDESPVPGAAGRATAAARRSGRRAGFAVGAVVGIVVGAAVTWPVLRRADTPPGSARSDAPRRFSITLPDWAPVAPPSKYPFGIALRMISLSPDGGMLVYTALVDGKLQLCLRDMATGEVQSVPGGEGGFGAVFSPDGRELAFFARERLLKLDLERRTAPELIADTSAPGGIDWASDGTIYFSPAENKPILAVAASGGAARPVTVQSAPGESHILPYLSADERMLMYTDYRGVVRVSATPLDGSQPARMLVEYGSDGRYVESGHVIFLREDRLMALPVRAATLEALGIPATIVSGVRSNWECGHFSLARDGTLVYMAGVPGDVARFVLVDRSGASEDPGLPLDRYVAFSLSPDGRRLATPVIEGADVDIWLYDLERVGTPARITFGGVHNHTCWSSEGRYLLFTRLAADGTSAVLAKDLESGAAAIEIMPRTSPTIPLDLDEKSGELLFSASTTDGAMDVMRGVVDLSAGAEVQVERIETLSATPYNEPFAAISPDRKWIVANSDETGRWELFLSSYPDFASRVQLSTHGGEEPRWTKDGGRVVYRWNDEWFEVEVTTEPSLVVGSPRRIASGPYINVPGYSWDMSRDADRLLLLEGPQQDTPATEIQVITGFIEELRRAAPPDRDG